MSRVPDFMPGYVDVKKVQYMPLGHSGTIKPDPSGHGNYGPRRLPPMAYPTGPYPLDQVTYEVLGDIIPHPRGGHLRCGYNPNQW